MWLSPCAVYTCLSFQKTAALQQILTKFGGYQASLKSSHVGVFAPEKVLPGLSGTNDALYRVDISDLAA